MRGMTVLSLKRWLLQPLRALPQCLLVASLLMVCAPSASAVQVEGLYSHSLSIVDESDVARNEAYSAALAAVIVKLTGGVVALELPGVDDALDQASDFVEGVSYASTPSAAGANGPESNQRSITVDFSRGLVDALLGRLGIPIWNSNRPSVLVWMAQQDADGQRRHLDPERDLEAVRLLEAFARTRGLPLLFPLLDFEDRQNLSESDLWDLRADQIAVASQRYGADSILSGRLLSTPSGELVGLWQFQFQGEVRLFEGLATELADYLEAPLASVAEQLSRYFALPSALATEQFIRLRVDGIRSLGDYAALLAYVTAIGVVADFSLASLDAERLELDLIVKGEGTKLSELIALDRDLLPIDTLNRGEVDAPSLLHYRWTR